MPSDAPAVEEAPPPEAAPVAAAPVSDEGGAPEPATAPAPRPARPRPDPTYTPFRRMFTRGDQPPTKREPLSVTVPLPWLVGMAVGVAVLTALSLAVGATGLYLVRADLGVLFGG